MSVYSGTTICLLYKYRVLYKNWVRIAFFCFVSSLHNRPTPGTYIAINTSRPVLIVVWIDWLLYFPGSFFFVGYIVRLVLHGHCHFRIINSLLNSYFKYFVCRKIYCHSVVIWTELNWIGQSTYKRIERYKQIYKKTKEFWGKILYLKII